MTLFDFKCDDCGFVEEHFVYHDGANSYLCPMCDGDMFRIFSPPRVISMGEEAQAYKALKADEKRRQTKKMYF